MTPPFDRPALEARLAKITPGEWVVRTEELDYRPVYYVGPGEPSLDLCVTGLCSTDESGNPDDENAEFIASAPADLRACLAEIDRLTKENEALRVRAKGAENIVVDVGLKLIGTGHEQIPITDAVSAVIGDLDRLSAEVTRLREGVIAAIEGEDIEGVPGSEGDDAYKRAIRDALRAVRQITSTEVGRNPTRLGCGPDEQSNTLSSREG